MGVGHRQAPTPLTHPPPPNTPQATTPPTPPPAPRSLQRKRMKWTTTSHPQHSTVAASENWSPLAVVRFLFGKNACTRQWYLNVHHNGTHLWFRKSFTFFRMASMFSNTTARLLNNKNTTRPDSKIAPDGFRMTPTMGLGVSNVLTNQGHMYHTCTNNRPI